MENCIKEGTIIHVKTILNDFGWLPVIKIDKNNKPVVYINGNLISIEPEAIVSIENE